MVADLGIGPVSGTHQNAVSPGAGTGVKYRPWKTYFNCCVCAFSSSLEQSPLLNGWVLLIVLQRHKICRERAYSESAVSAKFIVIDKYKGTDQLLSQQSFCKS